MSDVDSFCLKQFQAHTGVLSSIVSIATLPAGRAGL